jgi:hypothetical protein
MCAGHGVSSETRLRSPRQGSRRPFAAPHGSRCGRRACARSGPSYSGVLHRQSAGDLTSARHVPSRPPLSLPMPGSGNAAGGRRRRATAAFSLIARGSSSTSCRVGDPLCRSGLSWAHFSFGARVGAECSWELSRLLNSMRGRQAARKQRELAEAGSGRRGAAGRKGCWRERTCQAAIRILRATAALAGFLPARLVRSV